MRHKWLISSGAVLFVLTLLAVFGLAVGVNLAQSPQGPWINLETNISPGEVAIGDGFLTILTLRNEGTEPATVDAVSAELPAGAIYVGQAFGSDLADAAVVSSDQLRWTGPFTLPAGAKLEIRYWAIAGEQATPGQYPVRAAVLSGEESLVSAESPLSLIAGAAPEPASAPAPRVETAPALPSAIVVSKVATPNVLTASSPVLYTVTFTNNGTGDQALDTITDLLPSGFYYVGLAYGSEITEEPADQFEPEIVWHWDQDPPVVLAGGTLTLRYYVWVPGKIWDDTALYTNAVTAYSGSTPLGSADADVRIKVFRLRLPILFHDFTYPYFTVAKSVSPNSVMAGGEVVYTVRLTNGGDDPGILKTIQDTLPTGFIFKGTVSGPAGLSSPTPGATGKIIWSGSATVPAGASVTLVYKVQVSDTPGTYVNSATATTLVGRPPAAPASATVSVTARILLQENFENGTGNWTAFTNYWRLNEQQWFWDQGGGYGGSNGYTNWGNAGVPGTDPEDGAHDSLSMYLGAGAQEWTNYRYQSKFNLWKGGQVGVWFRGTYQDVATPGQWVTGYYFVIKVRDDNVTDTAMLLQLRTAEEPGDESNPNYWYHFSNPLQLAEKHLITSVEPGEWHQITIDVVNNRLICYVDGELAFDYTDTTGSAFLKGTVGFFTYGKWPNEAVVNYDDVLVEPLN